MSAKKDSPAPHESQPIESELDLIPAADPSWRLKRGATVKKADPAKTSPHTVAARTHAPVTHPADPAPALSHHGTPAATLYYGTSPRKDTPMTPTPTTTLRPTSAVDYRSNIERQTREQNSTGQILYVLLYSLVGLLLLGGLLAGYGTYVLSEQLHSQSVTISDLQKTFSAQNQILANQLNSTIQSLNDSQNQMARQQEEIDRLLAANQEVSGALRLERQARQSLQARVQHLEQR